jgi:hypothetical protein
VLALVLAAVLQVQSFGIQTLALTPGRPATQTIPLALAAVVAAAAQTSMPTIPLAAEAIVRTLDPLDQLNLALVNTTEI